jgi:hypothetical protein
VANETRRFDLGLHDLDRRWRLVRNPYTGTLGRRPSLRHGIDEVLHRRVEAGLGDRQRFEQTISTSPQLLDLGAPGLALASEIAQHPFAHDLGFVDHVATTAAAVLGHGFGLAGRLGEDFFAVGIRLDPDRIGCRYRFGSNRFGLAFSPLGPLGGGRVRCVKDLCRLGTKRLGNAARFERLGLNTLDSSQLALKRLHLSMQIAHHSSRPLQFTLHGEWFESAPNKFEGLTLKVLGVEIVTTGHATIVEAIHDVSRYPHQCP